MSRATPQMRKIAERLIAYETGGEESSATRGAVAFPVCEKLRPHLATLMGNAGVRSLFLRALAQAEGEVPSLRAVRVKTDGSLAVSDKPEVEASPEELAKGSVVLVAQLLGLLAAFIGEKLMLRIVCDVWPKLALIDLNLPERDKK